MCEIIDYTRLRIERSLFNDTEIWLSPCCIHLKNFLILDKNLFLNNNIKDTLKKLGKHNFGFCELVNRDCIIDYTKIDMVEESLTSTCNLHCEICRPNVNLHDNKSTEEEFKFLYNLKGLHLKCISPKNSGEIFLDKKFLYPWLNSLTREDTEQVVFITNATLINDDDIKFIKEYNEDKNKPDIRFYISIDGFTDTTYKSVRHTDLNKVKETTLKLIDCGAVSSVNYTISKLNMHEAEIFKKYWTTKGVHVNLHFMRESCNDNSILLSDEEKEEVQKHVQVYAC